MSGVRRKNLPRGAAGFSGRQEGKPVFQLIIVKRGKYFMKRELID